MYIPHYYKETDREKINSFIKAYPLGVLLSNNQEFPFGTHLPFFFSVDDENVLQTHIANANPHIRILKNNNKCLLIFQEPNGYVSPKNYEKETNVPTWNYISVHLYGTITYNADPKHLYDLMEKTINVFEPEYMNQWNKLPSEYVQPMLNQITGLDFKIESIEAKFKLSQNKTKTEQKNIIETFHQQPSTTGIANEMENFYKTK